MVLGAIAEGVEPCSRDLRIAYCAVPSDLLQACGMSCMANPYNNSVSMNRRLTVNSIIGSPDRPTYLAEIDIGLFCVIRLPFLSLTDTETAEHAYSTPSKEAHTRKHRANSKPEGLTPHSGILYTNTDIHRAKNI